MSIIENQMKLNDGNIKSFVASKALQGNADKINSLSYCASGELLLTSAYDDQMNIYDCVSGKHKKVLYSKKYGVNLITFTHNISTAVYASTKIDDTIRYLSLHDNKFIRYFPGHTKRVISVQMNPQNETFVSGSLDKTVKMWDFKAPGAIMNIQTLGRSLATFDPEGIVISIGVTSPTNHSLQLYDVRMADRGPFASFDVQDELEDEWTSVRHSPNGRLIAISSNGANLRLFDAFDGKSAGVFPILNSNPTRHPVDVCFSPDSNYLICGSPEGQLNIWNTENKNKVAIINGASDSGINQPISCIGFNPKFAMVASAGVKLTFWSPNIDE